MGNRQFPGAMATADWNNRLLGRGETRGGTSRARGRRGEGEVEMKGGETAVLVPRYSFFFSPPPRLKKSLDSISLHATPRYLCDSTTRV